MLFQDNEHTSRGDSTNSRGNLQQKELTTQLQSKIQNNPRIDKARTPHTPFKKQVYFSSQTKNKYNHAVNTKISNQR